MLDKVSFMRESLPKRTDLAVDMHGRYDLGTAKRVARELEPFKLLWLEEPVPPENVDAMRDVRESTSTPICAGENLFLRHGFRELLEKRAVDIIMPDETILEAQRVTKNFGGLCAVNNVNILLSRGEILGLIGPNGAGKTTLVNLISGYLKPDSGRILFLNTDITHASPYVRIKLGVGRSFQLIQLFGGITVLDNVRTALFSKYGMIRRGLLPADRYTSVTEEATEILKNFNLLDKKDLTPKALSEGDMKILDVAIAFALITKPGALQNVENLSLPDIDPTLVVLMGLSQGGYIGGKLVTSTGMQIQR
jgi:ABC-type lipopolysaccharide export system ATPase subunit